MIDLTERQTVVLDFLRSFIAKHGYPPAIREMLAHFGWTSTTAAVDHLRALERKGRIRREFGKDRAIVLLPGTGESPPGASADAPLERIPILASLEPFHVIATMSRPSCAPDAAWALVVTGDSLSARGIFSGDWLLVAPPPVAVAVPAGKLVLVRLFEVVVARYAFPEGDLVRLTTATTGSAPAFLRSADFARSLRGVACGLWRGAVVSGASDRAA